MRMGQSLGALLLFKLWLVVEHHPKSNGAIHSEEDVKRHHRPREEDDVLDEAQRQEVEAEDAPHEGGAWLGDRVAVHRFDQLRIAWHDGLSGQEEIAARREDEEARGEVDDVLCVRKKRAGEHCNEVQGVRGWRRAAAPGVVAVII